MSKKKEKSIDVAGESDDLKIQYFQIRVKMNRREFFKGLAIATGAAVVAPKLLSEEMTQKTYALEAFAGTSGYAFDEDEAHFIRTHRNYVQMMKEDSIFRADMESKIMYGKL